MSNGLRTIGLVAALALILGQAALLVHAAAADHGVGEACQVCLVKDRLAESAAIAIVAIALPPPAADSFDGAPPLPDTTQPATPRSRGPPFP